jgi:Arc/MetJ-type ribon-helix-helix transcriptional regulator
MRKGKLWRFEPVTTEIPPEYQPFVQHMVSSGAFPSEAAVVGEALRMYQERLDRLRAEIQPALDRLDRGEGIELDEESLDQFFEDIKAEGQAELETRQERK